MPALIRENIAALKPVKINVGSSDFHAAIKQSHEEAIYQVRLIGEYIEQKFGRFIEKAVALTNSPYFRAFSEEALPQIQAVTIVIREPEEQHYRTLVEKQKQRLKQEKVPENRDPVLAQLSNLQERIANGGTAKPAERWRNAVGYGEDTYGWSSSIKDGKDRVLGREVPTILPAYSTR